ncbi:MAG: broad specificity phosphatase PhoE [Candidatus Aldehydirespiratoraceae bacterium]|jgi:broad specificity phosphatase PhoE
MSDTRLLMVRHGESTWNAVRRWQGQADPPLSERGETQARRAAVAAPDHASFDLVITSSLQRARLTGELIAQALGVAIAPAISGLSERAAGEWEGLTRSEIEAAYPGYLEAGDRPPGYETDESIVQRAGASLKSLITEYSGRTVLVVSHGGIIHALERAHSGDDAWQRLDNLTGRWFEATGDGMVPTGSRVALVPDGGPAIPPPDPSYA